MGLYFGLKKIIFSYYDIPAHTLFKIIIRQEDNEKLYITCPFQSEVRYVVRGT